MFQICFFAVFIFSVAGSDVSQLTRARRSDDVLPIQAVVDGLVRQVESLTTRLTAAEAKIEAQEKQVVFHARHSTDPFEVAGHGKIIYDVADLNVGSGYDVKLGEFHAPVSGVYAFFVNCMAVDGTSLEAYIRAAGSSSGSGCYSHKPTGQPHEQGSTMTTVHLNAGDPVWVDIYNANAEQVRGSLWNTFSGFLLHADD